MNLKKLTIGLGFILLLFVTLQVEAVPGAGIEYEHKNGIATIATDNVTISVNAQGNIPVVHYTLASGLTYNVMFKQLIEYQDLNEDGAFQYNESLPGVPIFTFTSAKWLFSGFETDLVGEDISAIHFNFTLDQMMGLLYQDLDITIVFHLYMDDVDIGGYDLVGGTELKFDLYISGWAWEEVDSLLALRFDITSAEGSQIRNQHNQQLETTVNTTNNEIKQQNTEEIKQKFEIQQEGNKAYFAYANQSRIKNQYESQYRYSEVNGSCSSSGDGILQLFLSFEHFDELIYDPSLGTDDSGVAETSIAWMSAIILPILAVAVVKLAQKKKQ